MRWRATDGTKISTSLTITKKTVRISRRAERLFSSTALQGSCQLSAEAREKTHETAGTPREQSRRIIASRGALARLPARRVGHDQIGHRANLELSRNRQRPGQDQIAGPGAEYRSAEDAAGAVKHGLDEPCGVPLGLSAIVFDEGPVKHARSRAGGTSGGLGQADLGKLRIGVGDPGQGPVIDFGGQPE